MITRLTKLKGYPDVLMGRDLLKVFKEGHVYDVREALGVITIIDLGPSAMFHEDFPKGQGISGVATSGSYCLTLQEYTKELTPQNQ